MKSSNHNAKKSRGTKFFVERDRDMLPLLQRNEGGEGWGKEAVFTGLPLSLALSPFVPHGERVFAPRKSMSADIYSSPIKPMKSIPRRILSCAPRKTEYQFSSLIPNP